MGLDSVVNIATSYKLDGPGIESRCKQIFHTSPQAQPASCMRADHLILGLIFLWVKEYT